MTSPDTSAAEFDIIFAGGAHLPDAITAKHVVSSPSEHLNGRQLVVQTGHCVRGGSSINFTMYTRPAASDYDDWAKVEKFQALPGKPTHGYRVSVGQEYLDVVAKYDKARTFVEDANSRVDDVNHYQVWPKWINETGRRSDVSHHFLYNKTPHNKNLLIVVGSTVRRVISENGRAVGVQYVDNPRIREDAEKTRSGTGAREVLARYGIGQVVDLPGVGENYNDHPTLFVPFLGVEGAVTMPNIMRGDQEEITMESMQAASNVQPQKLKDIGPGFTKRWESFSAPKKRSGPSRFPGREKDDSVRRG
ncbi:hypothetical protein C8Q78DRAFT_1083652 [Trametes maxima]|nr:hypothetical protein C8Q78DRAFT_1083652 [Trametes maxima]